MMHICGCSVFVVFGRVLIFADSLANWDDTYQNYKETTKKLQRNYNETTKNFFAVLLQITSNYKETTNYTIVV